jgi:hypothetical protein
MVDLPGNDDHNDLAALDFSGGNGAGEESAESSESSLAALHDFAPAQTEDAATDLGVLQDLTEAEEEHDLDLFTVTNPQGSVSVSALMDGRIHQVKLTDKVESMGEPQLAEEIFVIADLARQKARAAQYTFMLENMKDSGDENGMTAFRELVSLSLHLPTPEEAAAAEEETFASRYYGGETYGRND